MAPTLLSQKTHAFLLCRCFSKLKAWLFCHDKVGAQASANLFTLVMTARANEVEPFAYLCYVFEHLPTATTLEALEALLPWNVKPVLEEQRKRQEAAGKSAAAQSDPVLPQPLASHKDGVN